MADDFAEIRASWTDAWAAFAEAAHAKADEIAQDFGRYAASVGQVVTWLRETGPTLKLLGEQVAEYERLKGPHANIYRANYEALARMYNNLVAGVFENAQVAIPRVQLGVAWFVVAGVTLSILGVCFAVAAYPYAKSLYEQAKAQSTEIKGRIEAMRTGKVLQQSTYQAPATASPAAALTPNPPSGGFSAAPYVFGGFAIVAVGTAFYFYARSQGAAK